MKKEENLEWYIQETRCLIILQELLEILYGEDKLLYLDLIISIIQLVEISAEVDVILDQ
jgi:hypothetical protein